MFRNYCCYYYYYHHHHHHNHRRCRCRCCAKNVRNTDYTSTYVKFLGYINMTQEFLALSPWQQLKPHNLARPSHCCDVCARAHNMASAHIVISYAYFIFRFRKDMLQLSKIMLSDYCPCRCHTKFKKICEISTAAIHDILIKPFGAVIIFF